MVVRAAGSWEPQPGDVEVAYELPAGGSAELRAFWAQSAGVTFTGDFIAQLPGGRVFGSGVVLSSDGRSIARDVSVDFGRPFHEHWLLSYQKIRPPVTLPGVTAVVATTLGAGYSHWLLEELPRLLVLRGRAFERLIAHATSAFSQAALDRLGLTATVVEARRYSNFACEQLVVPSLVGQAGFPTRKVGELLHDFTADIGRATGAHLPERIYVSRDKARRRRVVNEVDVGARLEARGFTKVCLEDLSWSEQIELFRKAKVIVAPHGAGLANLVFCQPGTRVIEFFHRSYVNGCYWRLASIRGLDYRPIVPPGPEPLDVQLAANRCDLVADVAQVEHAVVA